MARFSAGGVDPSFADRRWTSAGLIAGLLLLWALMFGSAALNSLSLLVDPPSGPASLSESAVLWRFLKLLGRAAVGFFVVWVVVRLLPAQRAWWSSAGNGSSLSMVRCWSGVHFVAAVCGLVLVAVGLRMEPMPVPVAESGGWLRGLTLVLAGFEEEPLLAALPVILLVGRVPLLWIVGLAAAMRGLLHVYYGPAGFVWAFVWGGGTALVYFFFRRLWLIIVLHGLFNAPVLALGHGAGLEAAVSVAKTGAIFVLSVWGAVVWYRSHPYLRRKVRWIEYRIRLGFLESWSRVRSGRVLG